MRGIALVLICAGGLWASAARADVAVEAGVKLWYAEPKVADLSLMYGVQASARADVYWVRGFFLRGENEFIQSREPRVVQSFTQTDAELAVGMDWDIFRFGLGARAASVLDVDSGGDGSRLDRDTAYGPMVSLGAAQSLSEWPWGFVGSPWGWYADSSLMFYDASDYDGEHLNVEGGLSLSTQGLNIRLGYRHKYYFDHEDIVGFVGSLTFDF